ncbi:c-type cytochrome [Azorhizobium doebereinerae]|uniref:c-type cytochrome n=1 Tax=Azorhizobium doebereinerae TaxID=281091 RepID=UPI00041B6ADE|nr:cytochrome c [Azorhizobium doebereinerae]
MRPELRILLGLLAVLGLVAPAAAGTTGVLGIGHVATQADIAAYDIDVRADGAGLPPGRGSVAEGKELFAATCAACHGDKGQGGQADVLAGGKGTLATAKPVKTVGSFWPYATTLFDYVNRAMPFTAPQSLSADQVYAVSAYVLFLNGLVPEDATLDAQSLPRVAMPNRNGFTSDPRPDVPPVARN